MWQGTAIAELTTKNYAIPKCSWHNCNETWEYIAQCEANRRENKLFMIQIREKSKKQLKWLRKRSIEHIMWDIRKFVLNESKQLEKSINIRIEASS